MTNSVGGCLQRDYFEVRIATLLNYIALFGLLERESFQFIKGRVGRSNAEESWLLRLRYLGYYISGL